MENIRKVLRRTSNQEDSKLQFIQACILMYMCIYVHMCLTNWAYRLLSWSMSFLIIIAMEVFLMSLSNEIAVILTFCWKQWHRICSESVGRFRISLISNPLCMCWECIMNPFFPEQLCPLSSLMLEHRPAVQVQWQKI